MANKKRSEVRHVVPGVATPIKTAASVIPSPSPARGTGVQFRQAFCPCCGMTKGKVVTRDAYGVKTRERSWWDYTRDPDKPFGVIFQTSGRGTLEFVDYFSPDPSSDLDGYYPEVKAHLLGAVSDWLAKGWLTESEVQAAIGKAIP